MQFDLPEETLMIRDTVRQFVAKELLPLEAEFDFEESNLPDDRRADLRKKVDDIGLGGMFIPEEYGGARTSATLLGPLYKKKLPRLSWVTARSAVRLPKVCTSATTSRKRPGCPRSPAANYGCRPLA